MIRILPKWYTEVEEELTHKVIEIANRLNLSFSWVNDSRTIKGAVDSICEAFVVISEKGKPEYTKEQLKEFEKLKKAEERGK